MAIHLPTSRIVLDPALFRWGRPILSGATTADAPGGVRGINSEQNHGYAYRVACHASHFTADPTTPTELMSTTSTSLVDCSDIMAIWAPDNFAKVRLSLWGSRVTAQLLIDGALASGDSNTAGATAELCTVDYTWASAGAWKTIQVRVKATATFTARVYGWCLTDVPMVAGNFP